MFSPVLTFQIFAVASALALASRDPSGELVA